MYTLLTCLQTDLLSYSQLDIHTYILLLLLLLLLLVVRDGYRYLTSVSHMTYLPLNGRSPSTSNSGDCLEHFLPFTVFLLPFHYFPLELTSYLLCVCVCVCVCVLSTLHPSPAAGRVQSVHLICMHACLVLNGHQNVHDSYVQAKSYVVRVLLRTLHLLFFLSFFFFFFCSCDDSRSTYVHVFLFQYYSSPTLFRHCDRSAPNPASRELLLSCICRA